MRLWAASWQLVVLLPLVWARRHVVVDDVDGFSLLQRIVVGCTAAGADPWATGHEVACCAGLESKLINSGGSWHYVCHSTAAPCSPEGQVPGSSGCCAGLQKCQLGTNSHSVCLSTCEVKQESTCLCMFDIDRTLTAKQGSTDCPGTRVLPFWDWAYGGGNATLSALSNSGIANTFCGSCYLGLCSAGQGSGVGSDWNNYLLNEVVRSGPMDNLTSQFPFMKSWSMGAYVNTPLSVSSPYVIAQPDKQKQFAVELVREWYQATFGIAIEKSSVHFFDDRTENIAPFKEEDLNAKQISCGSRDLSILNGMVGLCGAVPDEIKEVPGQVLCQ
mmetsp:Transcript_18526/g.34745  ORF Transcript_18526/g.34745 Transcript_18526/m.34745 type:complete len:330 (-) Transcript_18526:106-1095(-)